MLKIVYPTLSPMILEVKYFLLKADIMTLPM